MEYGEGRGESKEDDMMEFIDRDPDGIYHGVSVKQSKADPSAQLFVAFSEAFASTFSRRHF